MRDASATKDRESLVRMLEAIAKRARVHALPVDALDARKPQPGQVVSIPRCDHNALGQ